MKKGVKFMKNKLCKELERNLSEKGSKTKVIGRDEKNVETVDITTLLLGLFYINADNFDKSNLPERARKTIALSLLDMLCALGNCDLSWLKQHEKDLVEKVSGSSIDELLKYFGREKQ